MQARKVAREAQAAARRRLRRMGEAGRAAAGGRYDDGPAQPPNGRRGFRIVKAVQSSAPAEDARSMPAFRSRRQTAPTSFNTQLRTATQRATAPRTAPSRAGSGARPRSGRARGGPDLRRRRRGCRAVRRPDQRRGREVRRRPDAGRGGHPRRVELQPEGRLGGRRQGADAADGRHGQDARRQGLLRPGPERRGRDPLPRRDAQEVQEARAGPGRLQRRARQRGQVRRRATVQGDADLRQARARPAAPR